MKKKGVKRKTKIIVLTLILAINLLVILFSYNDQIQETNQINLDKNKKQLITENLKVPEKAKDFLQTITNIQKKDFILGLLNIDNVFYRKEIILYSDFTGYGYGEPDPDPIPEPYPDPGSYPEPDPIPEPEPYPEPDPIPEPDPDPYPNPDPGSKCQTNQDCDDDNICNGQEFCEQGICMFGNTLNCEDNDPCTHDYCANNQCVNNPLPDCQKK
ncbi:hypothetical protein HOE04_01000, partial [archaeon]|nr:hypothetical protein [archaeon]